VDVGEIGAAGGGADAASGGGGATGAIVATGGSEVGRLAGAAAGGPGAGVAEADADADAGGVSDGVAGGVAGGVAVACSGAGAFRLPVVTRFGAGYRLGAEWDGDPLLPPGSGSNACRSTVTCADAVALANVSSGSRIQTRRMCDSLPGNRAGRQ
jgi:hypothetical protein